MPDDPPAPPLGVTPPPWALPLPDRVTRLEVLRDADHQRQIAFEDTMRTTVSEIRIEFRPVHEKLDQLLAREAHANGMLAAGRWAADGFVKAAWIIAAAIVGFAARHFDFIFRSGGN